MTNTVTKRKKNPDRNYYTLTNSGGVAIWKAFVFPHSQEVPPSFDIPVALNDAAIVLPGLLVALHSI